MSAEQRYDAILHAELYERLMGHEARVGLIRALEWRMEAMEAR